MNASLLAKAVRRLAAAALMAAALAAVLVAAWPWLDAAWYAMRLAAMPAPTTLAMPMGHLTPAALRDTWQAARPPNRRHEGIDIFAKRGTPVLSTTEGVVLSLGENALGGQVAWVLGPGGQRHYYAHLDRFADVRKGDRIAAGAILGFVGNTGNARTTPPHLHYGVYTSAGAINPFPLLKGRQALDGGDVKKNPHAATLRAGSPD